MGGINTVSGLRNVSIDYRPQVGPDAAKAAGKSVSADAAEKVKSVGDMLVKNGVITAKESARLESLAKDASEKLAALDDFSGRKLAKALNSHYINCIAAGRLDRLPPASVPSSRHGAGHERGRVSWSR